jgi:hypothetical protein
MVATYVNPVSTPLRAFEILDDRACYDLPNRPKFAMAEPLPPQLWPWDCFGPSAARPAMPTALDTRT